MSALVTKKKSMRPDIFANVRIFKIGHSAANAACRIGAVLTSYAVESDLSLFNLGILMAMIHIMTALCCAYLPETKDLALGKIPIEPN